MAYIIEKNSIPICRKRRPRCNFDCEHCGVDYSKAYDDDEQDDSHNDGFGTHW